MNGRTKSNHAVTEQLCSACGLCCNGTIFANVALQPGDDSARLQSLGLPVHAAHSVSRPPHLMQPCAAFDGCHCRIYSHRPKHCRDFECALLKDVQAGRTDTASALRVIRAARARVDKVHRLLRALGDADEHLPLKARFRKTGQRLQEGEVSEKAANTYAQLTLAVHDLNLLLGDSFYPGRPQREPKAGRRRAVIGMACISLVLLASAVQLQADQVELGNGDRYVGHVLSLNSNTVLLQSEVLGTVRLPRSKVAVITLGRTSGSNSPALRAHTNAQDSARPAASTNATAALHPALRQLGVSTNLIQQVQKQFLSGAGAQANDKFNELLGGLMSGKVSVDDIRAQAKAAADQLRALQRESGEDTGFAASAYLSILDHFLKETAPTGATTNPAAPSAASKPAPAEKEE